MIDTQRLTIRPLTREEMHLLANAPAELELLLGVPLSESLLSEETREAVVQVLLPNLEQTGKDPLFWTMWIVIEKSSGRIAGGICFHGEPDENGEVEIGYGTDSGFQGQGIMTEVVAGVLKWLGGQPRVRAVRAETDITNPASIRVLEKNGFREVGRTESTLIHQHSLPV